MKPKSNDIRRRKDFGDILRRYRTEMSASQEGFAEMCGLSRAYYGKVELGEHSMTIDQCFKIAEALQITVSDLFKDLPD